MISLISWNATNVWKRSDTFISIGLIVIGLLVPVVDQVFFTRRFGAVNVIPERRKDARLLSSQTKRDIVVATIGQY